ncbi:MAG: sulfatase-like hydrolase/transferase [Acidobacteria bacterium]|nr:sulfatase-like hydrolase/transferase [Acidobacteriota bacterium]
MLIVSDDQGYADLGCCGRPELKSPNLDRIVAEGVRATDFYVSWPACTPSRGSILTGRYPQRNGLYDMIRNDVADFGVTFEPEEYAITPEAILGLDTQETVIAEVMKKAGYATGVVGKWDSGQLTRYRPRQRGFDFFYGFTNTGIDYFTHERYGWPSMWRDNDKVKESGYATDLFEREGVRFLEEHHDEPFFLYMPFNAPHGASNFDKAGPQAKPEHLKMYGSEEPGTPQARYLGSITAMDESIGELFATLEKYDELDNTLVIFFSDNGGAGRASNAPLHGKKATMWEGGVRVVFAARWPGKIPAGTVTHEFLTSLEVFPTLVKLAGAELPQGVKYDGFDMLPVLAGQAKSEREQMVWERRNTRALRYRNWKWVEAPDYGGLFDLSADIGEKHDLSAEKPDVLRMMQKRFWDWKAEMQAAEPRGPFRDF